MTPAGWCAMLSAILRLVAGKGVTDQAIAWSCAGLEYEMVSHHAEVVVSVDDSTSWRVVPMLGGETLFTSAWIRVTPRGGESLTDQRPEPDILEDVGLLVGWQMFYAVRDSVGATRPIRTAVCLDLVPITIVSAARRRVLALELYDLLPDDLRCD